MEATSARAVERPVQRSAPGAERNEQREQALQEESFLGEKATIVPTRKKKLGEFTRVGIVANKQTSDWLNTVGALGQCREGRFGDLEFYKKAQRNKNVEDKVSNLNRYLNDNRMTHKV